MSRPASRHRPPTAHTARPGARLAAHLGVEDREPAQREQRVDDVDLEAVGPLGRGEPTGQDRPHLFAADSLVRSQLGPHPTDQARDQVAPPEDGARPQGRDRVAPDRAAGLDQRDARQLGRRSCKRAKAEFRSRRDRAPEERTVGRDRVDGDRGPDVRHHGRRPVEPMRGEGVDQAVGTDLERALHPDREREMAGLRDPQRDEPAVRDPSERVGQRGHDRRPAPSPTPRRAGGRRAAAGVEQQLELVGRRPGSVVARRTAPNAPSRTPHSVRFELPDIDHEQHAPDHTARPAAARDRARAAPVG